MMQFQGGKCSWLQKVSRSLGGYAIGIQMVNGSVYARQPMKIARNLSLPNTACRRQNALIAKKALFTMRGLINGSIALPVMARAFAPNANRYMSKEYVCEYCNTANAKKTPLAANAVHRAVLL